MKINTDIDKKIIVNFRPLVLIAISLIIGILFSTLGVKDNLIFLVVAIIYIICLIVFIPKKFVLICLIASLFGYLSFFVDFTRRETPIFENESHIIYGRVKSTNYLVSNTKKYILEDIFIDGENYNAFCAEITINSDVIFDIGDVLECQGILNNVYIDPYDSKTISYYRYKIDFLLTASYAKVTEQTDLSFSEKIKSKTIAFFKTNLSATNLGVATSLVFGDKSYLQEDDNNAIKDSGLAHIFAVSGLHIGFMVAILLFVSKKLHISPEKTLPIILSLLIFYGVLTGFSPSITRAILMTTILLISEIIFRRVDILNSLMLTVILILLFKPLYLFEVGFQMSVLSIVGILFFYSTLAKPFRRKTGFVSFACKSATLSLSANIMLLPIMVGTFGTFSVYFIFANILIVPLASLSYMLIVTTSMAQLILPIFGFALKFVALPLNIISLGSSLFASLPYAVIKTSSLGLFSILYYLTAVFMSKYIMVNSTIKFRVLTTVGVFAVVFALI